MPTSSSISYTVGLDEWEPSPKKNKKKNLMDRLERFLGCSEAKKVDLWKNGCFFAILTSLTLLTLLNLSLNLWLIKTLHLRNGGLGFGNFLLRDDGLDVLGKARFEDGLKADELETLSQEDELTFTNHGPISLHSNNGPKLNSFTLSDDQIELQADNLEVKGGDEIVFKASQGEITTGIVSSLASKLNLEGGIKFTEFLQTNSIQGHYGRNLRLESRAHGVELMAEKDLALDSIAGAMKGQSFDEMILSSNQGILLHSLKVELKNLKRRERLASQSYQVCGCLDGKLFLAPGSRLCEAGPKVCPNTY